jgi:hypothetical protein
VCVGYKGELVKVLETRMAAPATLAVSGTAFAKQYERSHAGEVTAVYGAIPKALTKTETAK